MLDIKYIRLNAIFMLLFIVYNGAIGQQWIRIYGNGKMAVARDVKEVYDKGYFILGDYKNYKYSWIIKTDINGYILWDKKVGNGSFDCSANTIIQTSDKGFVLSGSTAKYDNYNDPFFMKFSKCAELEWCNVLYTPNNIDFGETVAQTSDGGYLFLCRYYGYDIDLRIHLFKFDSLGELIWHQFYPPDSLMFGEESKDLIVDSLSVLISGDCYYPDPGQPGGCVRPYFIKTDLEGNEIWRMMFDTSGYHYGFACKSISSPYGDYYAVGRHEATGNGDRASLMKISATGQTLYDKDLIPNTTWATSNTINFLNDTTLMLGTSWEIYNVGIWTTMLKTDTFGNIIDSIEFPPLTNNIISTIKTFDTKFVSVAPDGAGTSWKIYAFKINSDMEYDSIYTYPFVYDSLCPYPIVSDTIDPECDLIVGSDEPLTNPEKSQMIVFPNPAGEMLTIRLPDKLVRKTGSAPFTVTTIFHQWKTTTVEIYDLFSRLKFREEIPASVRDVTVDTHAWPKGLYVVRLLYRNELLASEKVVIH